VRTLTDASGSATDSYVYDAFGSQIATSGSTPNRYGFTGEQFDDDLGLYYLRARYYNQSNGRFLSRDTYPLNQIRPREWNRYSYVAGDPVNAVDPSGLTAIAQQGMHFNLETLKAIPKAILLGWSVSCILTLVSQQIGVLLRGNCTIYSGVIQIQGDDITGTTSGAVPDKAGQGYMISQAWYLNRPLTAPEARSRLAALMMVLTYEQKMNRYSTQVNSLSAYEKAVRLTYECQSNGGCLPLNISYKNPEFKDKRFAPRIDMIISAGKNFT
jgi:RHS repeat-associated protein